MTLDEYQKEALVTALYSKDDFQDLMHWVLGIVGESGEIAEKLKKIVRDKNGKIDEHDREELVKEIGDTLWYLAVFADHLGISLDEVGKRNIAKLHSRQNRDQLRGKGDNR
jgi:NTP pyrophosphatase (non-canonical NTP hydrolase)